MKAWIAKRPALSFYLLTLALSWGYWFTLLALGLRVGPGSVAHFPGLLGPMLAAIVVTAILGGYQAAFKLFKRMVWLGPRWAAKLMLALSPLALGAAAYGVMALLGKPLPALSAFARSPGLPEGWPIATVIVAVVVVNGLGEETGWRGFLTECLLPMHGRFRATLFVASLWALWHLPLFLLNTSMAAMVGPLLIGWLFALACGAFVLAQVYFVTGRSILCAALWHTAYNMMISSNVGTGLPAAIVGTAVMIWGVMVAFFWWRALPEPSASDIQVTPLSPP